MVQTVLVTGGQGFVGHFLVEYLLRETDYNVISLDKLNFQTPSRLEDVLKNLDEKAKSRFQVVYHDLRAEMNSDLRRWLKEVNIIVHMAGHCTMYESIENPMEFVQAKLDLFIFGGTSTIFGGSPQGLKYAEMSRYNSTTPYAATKAAAEEICVAFENTYKMPIYIVHIVNVFGERQAERFIPKVIGKILNGKTMTIHFDASTETIGSRQHIHGMDVADALVFLMKNKIRPETEYGGAKCPKFNIVGQEEPNNLQLAEWIAKILDKDLDYQLVNLKTWSPGCELTYALSGEYMTQLGWKPKVTLKERLEQTIAWYLENPEWLD